jgi:hypothetical protein
LVIVVLVVLRLLLVFVHGCWVDASVVVGIIMSGTSWRHLHLGMFLLIFVTWLAGSVVVVMVMFGLTNTLGLVILLHLIAHTIIMSIITVIIIITVIAIVYVPIAAC